MKIFHSEKQRLHVPEWYLGDGTVRPCPEVPGRAEVLVAAVRGAGHEVVSLEGLEATMDIGAVIGAIHSADYLEYLRTIYAVWVGDFGREGATQVLPDTFPRERVGDGEVKRPAKPAAQTGFYCFDLAAPIVAGTWEAAVGSAACAVAAADFVGGGGRAAYALCRPPGHHAGRDYCGGFCYLNNAAAAAQRLVMKGAGRVAVLDIDYHHGNGTQDIFYDRGDVLFVSVHADPGTQYPYFWGTEEERGAGAGEGMTRNFPLARGTTEGEWMSALERALAVVREFGAEALVVSVGLDISAADPVGDFCVTGKGFERIGRMLAGLGVPTVLVQEGGYNVGDIGESLVGILKGFEAFRPDEDAIQSG